MVLLRVFRGHKRVFVIFWGLVDIIRDTKHLHNEK